MSSAPGATVLGRLDAEGWAAVGAVLVADEAVAVTAACERAIDGLSGRFRRGDGSGPVLRRLVAVAERVPEAGVVWQHPALLTAAAHALGGPATLVRMTYRAAAPGHGRQTLHVDAPTAGTGEPCDLVLAVVALCEFTETNGATRVVLGSHRRSDLDPGAAPEELRDRPDVPLLGPAGSGFVLHGHLLHRGAENRSDAARPALLLGYGRAPVS